MNRDFLWWLYINYEHQVSRTVKFYDFVVFGIIKNRTEIVRWDHPEKKLVEKYFRDDTIRRNL